MFMFTELPLDIQELVISKLNVRDRTRLRISLMKSDKHRAKFVNKDTDKPLGVLTKAMKRGRVHRLSDQMIQFINKIDSRDATLAEIRVAYPAYKITGSGECQRETNSENRGIPSVLDLFQTNSTHFEDVTIEMLNDLSANKVQDALHHVKPNTFDAFAISLAGAQFMSIHMKMNGWAQKDFIFSLINYGNRDLFEHIRDSNTNGANLHGFDMRACNEYLESERIAKILCSYNARARLLYTELFNVTQEMREKLYDQYLSEMNIDAALFFE